MNILFVCTGNTCRSPMAEGFMNKISSQNDNLVSVSSRGIMVVPGSSVSLNSVRALSEFGIDISDHVPRGITSDDIEKSDLVLTMTSSQCEVLKKALPGCEFKIHSLGSYVGSSDISDPYGGSYDVYKDCAIQLEEAIDTLYDKINKQYE